MQTLVEVGRQEYESVHHYLEPIFLATANAARTDSEKVGAQGIEFWTSLAEEEFARSQRNAHVQEYVKRCSSHLIKLLIECVQKINIDDEDEDEDEELGVSLSSVCCLRAIALVIGNDIMEPVLAFVSLNINDENWKMRYSSLIALGSITEGPDKARFMNVIIPGLSNLIAKFKDPHSKVREAIAFVMNKICEHHTEVIMNS